MISTMKSMAAQGGGSYYDATNIQKLYDAFAAIFEQIQGTPSVFVSSSLPVSVNTQGTYLNQVFIGMFQPDKNASPKWLGNLKQYQLKYDAATNTLRLADANSVDAIDAGTGFVSNLATQLLDHAVHVLDELGGGEEVRYHDGERRTRWSRTYRKELPPSGSARPI